ncbi:MAG: type III-B CRISPR module RAMP protein Cmr4 [Zetaproteobacteria bacterium]|nr:MAG: type III-B CRISPR module RAMP protein Cmr4 [Zetaproteobacteria bacterium]
MFQKAKAMFMYCITPVHAGAGQALGVVDNPIQREVHTEHPIVAGSGVKGALRHHLWRKWENGDGERTRELLNRIFGPEAGSNVLHAGAISFTDAQLVAFPVRSVKRGFVYATSPSALARAKRLLELSEVKADWRIDEMEDGHAKLLNPRLLSEKNLLLESQSFEARIDGDEHGLKRVAEDLARFAIPQSGYFRDKLKQDLVLLSDTDFTWFVKQSTLIEAHVRIDDETGAADSGGLFYTENLPPESILLSAVLATPERTKDDGLQAEAVLKHVENALDGETVQIGGDATTGRGLVTLSFVGGESHAQS